MTAHHLHLKQHVGTTYKRALKRFHLSRDRAISGNSSALSVIETVDNPNGLTLDRRPFSMRKPRDYDAELRALTDKARQLKIRKQNQLGELVMATGADGLSAEELAGALLAAVSNSRDAEREAWRKRGAAFFSGQRHDAGPGADGKPGSAAPGEGRAQSAATEPGAA